MNILLLEPDRPLAHIYSRALQYAGHNVEWRADAQSAVLAIDTTRPDVVILEPQLATHSGIEFLYELRSYADLQDIPVIMHTFVPKDKWREHSDLLQMLGVTRYAYKPTTSLQSLVQMANRAQV